MGIHDDVGGADVVNRGNYFLEGIYPIAQVEQLFEKRSNDNDDLMICEFAILESNVEGRGTGTRASQVYNFRHKPTPGNVKAMLMTLYDCEEKDVDKAASILAVSEDQPLTGRLVRIEATETMTSGKDPHPFTVVKFITLPEDVQQKAIELRAAAGFEPLEGFSPL